MIFDGVQFAAAREVALKDKLPPGLGLGILAFDDDRAGQAYSRLKAEAAARLGIKIFTANRPEILTGWAKNKSVSGILIQYPGWRGREFAQQWQTWVNRIPAKKDVDGLRIDSPFIPATVKAIEAILMSVKAAGKILVVGRGMVGRRTAGRLKAENLSSHDPDLTSRCLEADILITACGRSRLITGIKPGAVVIDAGWPKGDVDFDLVKEQARVITPVPGGVGPVTVVCLLENLLNTV